MKKIVITGVAGFIGFHSALKLQARGDTVLGWDNFNNYYDPQLKRERAKMLSKAGIQILEGDIRNKEGLNKAIKEFQPTHFLHLAAQAGVRYSLENPQAYIDSNIEGFLNVLECCKEKNIVLTYASSSSVYGLNRKTPFSIKDPTERQASFYGVTKKSNELMAATYHHLYQIPVTGLRFFTVYGPWGRPDMAYFSFTKAILEGQPIKVFNHGEMERDFTYIDDIVDGILGAIDRESLCALYNLGNHHPEKLETLIRYIEERVGKKADRILLPHQSGDVLTTYADISESQEELGFYPKISLKEGMNRFLDWYLNH